MALQDLKDLLNGSSHVSEMALVRPFIGFVRIALAAISLANSSRVSFANRDLQEPLTMFEPGQPRPSPLRKRQNLRSLWAANTEFRDASIHDLTPKFLWCWPLCSRRE